MVAKKDLGVLRVGLHSELTSFLIPLLAAFSESSFRYMTLPLSGLVLIVHLMDIIVRTSMRLPIL